MRFSFILLAFAFCSLGNAAALPLGTTSLDNTKAARQSWNRGRVWTTPGKRTPGYLYLWRAVMVLSPVKLNNRRQTNRRQTNRRKTNRSNRPITQVFSPAS
jgi:hypothetical protein